ncbi:lactate utilization protein [soil metagenome]
MNSRERILTRIRQRTRKGAADDGTRATAIGARMTNPRANLIPLRGQGDDDHRIAVFTYHMEGVGGTVEVIDDVNDIPERVAVYLRDSNRPAHIRKGADALLATLPWHRAGTLEVTEGRADPSDTASLTHAFAGVAESGTIVQISGQDNPTTLNFLPEAHIVVLDVAELHASYEEAWTRLRKEFGPGEMPRTVNMISGPSRTADIEQTIVRPAHGPKDMHVIIVRR